MRLTKSISAIFAALSMLLAVPATAAASPAAESDSNQDVQPYWSDMAEVEIPGTGGTVVANAWQCNVYTDKCDFQTAAKAWKNGRHFQVDKIVNTATLTANGIQAEISISPTGKFVSKNIRKLTWENTNTWISDLRGVADPSGLFDSMTTCSDASVFVDGTKGFAGACANG
ncbi:hypothetical protein [Actinopolyspora alba]|uniref:hypothetical protein n=1 Tax=Actinopolyspora alba TaxID=673379 RepID=UPI001114156C|nr:hypothetical protein [Actinopolyspora alba]